MKKFIALGAVIAFMPVLAFAATLDTILSKIGDLVNAAVPIVIALAVLFFIISLVKYLLKEGEEKAAAKTQMIWGIVILFAIVAMWGLVNVLKDTFNVGNDDIDVPVLVPSDNSN